ncbi:centrosomal protein of 162 kDa isoform X2 [Leuresthes tenuis]|uniref:centrosomal protein of 162 kDa isoform X2 n=1 Tax=Leuresthes tenuis TaxID=355514 RepID=UPI003B500FAB
MSHRLTKEDLDAQFEQFLKESVSDDSVDLGGPDKQPQGRSSQKSNRKPTLSWWQDDEHSSEGTGGAESPKRRFIKAKKSQPEINKVVSREPFQKPVPKPRSKAPGKPIQPDKTPKAVALGISQTVERHRASSDDSCSESLSPTQENLHSLSGERNPDETGDTQPASSDGHSQGGSDNGSAMTPAANITSVGLDTLDEEEEKDRFFAQLEAGASSTVDYAKLNRELDSTSSTIATDLRKAEEAALEQTDGHQSKARVTEIVRESPACTGSPHYSEDFEDEENMKEPLEELGSSWTGKAKKSKMSPILARVSLYDSLDDTGEEDRRRDSAGSLDRGQPYVQSGGSEMEALQEAYRQIQAVQNSDDQFLSLESRARICRPTSPSSHPQLAQQSLQPASTNESDLPTAEELMRPIRPENEQIGGFTLQPVSAVENNQENVSQCLERTFPILTHNESEWKQPGKARTAAALTTHPSSCADTFNHDLKCSISEEVDRLMQDQKSYSTQTSSHASKAKKPGSCGFSERRPTVAPVRGRTVDGRTAVKSRSSGMSRTASRAKAQISLTFSPHHSQRTKSKKISEKDDGNSTESGLKVSSELVASVQSLVAVLQQQMDTSSPQDAAHEVRGAQETRLTHPPQISEADSSAVEVLNVKLAREVQKVKEAAEELTLLRQQNFLLQSKLRSAEETSEKKRWVEASDAATEEKLKQMNKEIKEQETLMKGYQQENEKLYLQVKAQQAKSKANEEAMFNENQRLLNELAFTREQLNKISKPVGSWCMMDHTQRISDLLAQISVLQRNEAKLSEDSLRLKQEKQSLEVDLQLMTKERDLAKAQAISTSGTLAFEMRVVEDKHRADVAALTKKLQWFAENQELLDRDAGRLKTATAEIHQLKEQLERLKQEVGKRSNTQQKKAKDKSMDSKRMQDLEHQVKELEQILRSRNPNSLPALIYAAAMTAGNEHGDRGGMPPPNQINTLLERRIQRLEAELESHDEDAKRSLRAMEQHFHRIKLRYEQQITELEQQLEQKMQVKETAETQSWLAKYQAVEEELLRVKESHQKKEKCLREQIESIQQQLKNKAQPSPGRHQRQAEAAFGARIERLNQELATKTRSIQELSRTVERLQKERKNMLSIPVPRPESCSTETKQQPGPTKTHRSATEGEPHAEEAFPSAQYEKTYQPTVFTGSHISEVLQEREALQERVKLLQLQNEQDKADAAQAKEELCRLKEQSAEQLSSMKAEHLRVLDHLRASHALEHSSSKVAQLANKLNTQEIAMKHLQEQLKELQGSREALDISRSREDAVQKQLTRLLQELKEAKEAQSSEVKLLCSLERKILSMELRHQHRERELQQVIGGTLHMSGADLQSEVERWKRLAQDKSRELEAFRLELDSILDILRHLQRQGVVLPTHDQPVKANTENCLGACL